MKAHTDCSARKENVKKLCKVHLQGNNFLGVLRF